MLAASSSSPPPATGAPRPPPSFAAKPTDSDFVPAATFGGARPGMVFKMDARGLGYYTDTAAAAAVALSATASCGARTATTIDHSRTVVRQPSLRARAPSTLTPPVWSDVLGGSARAAVEPLDADCGRRTATAWRWSAPRRAISILD